MQDKKIKAVFCDVDDSLLNLDTNEIKEELLLVQVLRFINASDIELGIITNRVVSKDAEETVSVSALREKFSNAGIQFNDNLVLLYDHEVQTKLREKDVDYHEKKSKGSLSEESYLKKLDTHIAGKNLQIRLLRKRHQILNGLDEKLKKDEIVIFDDKQEIIDYAKKAGFGTVKVTDPKQKGVDYLHELAEKVGLKEYADELHADPLKFETDPANKKASALMYLVYTHNDKNEQETMIHSIQSNKNIDAQTQALFKTYCEECRNKTNSEELSTNGVEASQKKVENKIVLFFKSTFQSFSLWINNKMNEINLFIDEVNKEWQLEKGAEDFLSRHAKDLRSVIKQTTELVTKKCEGADYSMLSQMQLENCTQGRNIALWSSELTRHLSNLGISVEENLRSSVLQTVPTTNSQPEYRLLRFLDQLTSVEKELATHRDVVNTKLNTTKPDATEQWKHLSSIQLPVHAQNDGVSPMQENAFQFHSYK